MDIKGLTRPLNISEIDFRIQSINKGKFATILAYKDARADMNRLDEVVGALNWKREHTRNNHGLHSTLYYAQIKGFGYLKKIREQRVMQRRKKVLLVIVSKELVLIGV